MRPDDHKKKRSAQYKKKHGIKSDNTDDNAQKSKKGKTKSVQESTSTRAQPSSKSDISRRQGQYGTGTDYEHDQGQKHDEDHVFRKRQMESNWTRYEGLPSDPEEDEEVITQRGADFKQMLDAAGEALSQFRFQDEKDWKMEGESPLPSCLSLDAADLSIALSCIPLHERLSIDESKFKEEDIQQFKRDAEISRQGFSLRTNASCERKKENESNSCSDSSAKTISPGGDDLDQNLDDILGENVHVENIKPSNTLHKDLQFKTGDVLDTILDNSFTNAMNNSVDPKNTTQHIVNNTEENEDMLDEILNNTTPVHKPAFTEQNDNPGIVKAIGETTCNKPDTKVLVQKEICASSNIKTTFTDKQLSSSHKNAFGADKPGTTLNLEDELDSLLSLDEQPKPPASVKKIANNTGNKQGENDLEDWLDSMLE